MASAAPATPTTKETTNYARLCCVLVDLGTCALRDCFDAICTPPTLHTILAASHPSLKSFGLATFVVDLRHVSAFMAVILDIRIT